jgi:hypothetical protein
MKNYIFNDDITIKVFWTGRADTTFLQYYNEEANERTQESLKKISDHVLSAVQMIDIHIDTDETYLKITKLMHKPRPLEPGELKDGIKLQLEHPREGMIVFYTKNS